MKSILVAASLLGCAGVLGAPSMTEVSNPYFLELGGSQQLQFAVQACVGLLHRPSNQHLLDSFGFSSIYTGADTYDLIWLGLLDGSVPPKRDAQKLLTQCFEGGAASGFIAYR